MWRHLLFIHFVLFWGASANAQPVPLLGVDCNYALDMARRGQIWKDGVDPVDPIQLFAEAGVSSWRGFGCGWAIRRLEA